MVPEHSLRRPSFVEGVWVRLADGQHWSLPRPDPTRPDPEYESVLRLIAEAQDRADLLRAYLAATIFFLSRNYDLGPAGYQLLLSYPPGAPELNAVNQVVHRLTSEAWGHLQAVGRPPRAPHKPENRRAWHVRGLGGQS